MASNISRRFYPQTLVGAGGRIGPVGSVGSVLALLLIVVGGCKKRPIAENPEEHGKLPRIAARLEEAFGEKSLPGLAEPEKLADRLGQWDDFRSCTVRAYVAKKRAWQERQREGLPARSRHASIGEAAVEECAVHAAVVKKDASMCERLAIDFAGPSGEMPLSAVRCWDTRARVLGLPEECPVMWLPDDLPGRNPECLAAARRDQSLCHFAEDPSRCRAILLGDPALCQGALSPDCALAAHYWSGLIPLGVGPPLIDFGKAAPSEARPVFATVDILWPDPRRPTLRIDGPRGSCAVSWPAGKTRMAWTEDTTKFWGATVPEQAVQLTWRAGQPAVKIAFVPGGASTGVRLVKPPSPASGATVLLVWPDPQALRRCLPGPGTTGQLRFDAGAAQPGSFVTGSLEATDLACSDGTTVGIRAEFRLVILDRR